MFLKAKHEIVMRDEDNRQMTIPANGEFATDDSKAAWLVEQGAAEILDAKKGASQVVEANNEADNFESRLVVAIGELPSGEDHWTAGGKPEVSALSEAVGEKVTAAQRDAAFQVYEENSGDV